jgi:hypothetical protein
VAVEDQPPFATGHGVLRREAFAAARKISDAVVELVLPDTSSDALSVLALAPEVVRVPLYAPDAGSVAHALELLVGGGSSWVALSERLSEPR